MPITQSTIIPLEHGEFRVAYHQIDDTCCVSVSLGDLMDIIPVVRLHSSCLFGEAFQGLICDCAAQLSSTLKMIRKNKSGVVVYSFKEGRGIGLEAKINALELQRTQKLNTIDAFKTLGFEPDIRDYHAEIVALKELSTNTEIKIASQNPNKRQALEQAGFTIVEQLHPNIKVTPHNIQELITKRDLLGYNIPIELTHGQYMT